MKIQGILDLSGFELQNFCIQNYTDKANVANIGRGRKFFFTGNSTDQDYNREVIWDGGKWRAAAYLDDLDKINEKLDLIFGDELDTDTIIDSWKEVQDFLSGIEDTKNLMTMLDGKLDTKGGTIRNSGAYLLEIDRTDGKPAILFSHNGSPLGYLGYDTEGNPIAHVNSVSNILIHSGNVGDYTAGAANRLANKVSLWGNEFDGTQSLNGGISIKNSSGVYFANASGENVLAAYINSANKLIFGAGTNSRKYSTYIHGNNIYFNVGDSATTAMTITDGGNVLVGVASQTNTDFKFEVSGLSRIYTAGQSMSLGKVPTSGLVLGSSTGLQGQFYFDYSGNICLQGQSVSDSTTRALNLNPLGGAVNVGGNAVFAKIVSFTMGETYYNRAGANYLWAPKEGGHFVIGVGANIGDAYASLSIYDYAVRPGSRNNAVSLGTSSYRWSNVYSVLGNFSGRVLIGGAQDDGTSALQMMGGIAINGDTYIRRLYPSASLEILGNNNELNIESGDSGVQFINYRKSSRNTAPKTWMWQAGSVDTYANFVLGHATFNGGALIPTGQKLTIGDANGDHATIEYDSIAKAIKVDGNLFTTGTNASGGKADAQQGGTGGNAEVYKYDLDWGEQVYEIQNVKGDVNVNVQVYEWNGNGNSWDMILTDVSVTANIITVTFGRPTSVDHMVTVV